MLKGYTSVTDGLRDSLRESLRLLVLEEAERREAFEATMTELRVSITTIQTMIDSMFDQPSPESETSEPELHDVGIQPAALPIAEARELVIQKTLPPKEWAKILRGLTHAEALIRIAEHQNGILKTVEAKKALIDSRLVKGNPKNVLPHIFAMLRDEERWQKMGVRWEKISPGTYQLFHQTSVTDIGNGSGNGSEQLEMEEASHSVRDDAESLLPSSQA